MPSIITKGVDQTKIKLTIALGLTSIFALGLIFLITINPVIAAVIAISVFVLIVFIVRTDIGLYLVVFSLIAGQLIRIPVISESNVQLTDVLVVLLSSIWLIKKIILNQKIKRTMLGPFLLIFLSIALISFVNGLRFLSLEQAMVSLFYLIRLWSYAALFFIATDIFSQEKTIIIFKKILLFTFFAVALAGVIQVIIFPNLARWAALYGWDPHVGRLFSTFLDPNFVGAFLTFGFIFSISLLTYAKTFENRIVLILISILELISIILTYSRSTYLFLFISFLVLSIMRSKKLLLIGIVALIILMLIFPRSLDRIQGGFNIDESAKTRFKTWENTITVIRDHPLLGVGFNSFRYAQEDYSFNKEAVQSRAGAGSDSSLLFIFVTTGFFGLLSYLIFYLLALIKTKKVFNFSTLPHKRVFALTLFSILIGFLGHSIFINSLFYPALMVLFFTLLGIISVNYYKE